MSWTSYPALGERLYDSTLSNGLRLCVVPKPGFAGKLAFLGVNFGSCDAQFQLDGVSYTVPDGTAHFLEHRMFYLPDCDPESEFSRLGAESNAFTDYGMTGYYFSCTDHFDDCLRLLLRMAAAPYFPAEAMADERAVIADEIALYDDSPGDCAQERLYRALYRRHPIRIPIAGSRRSIRAVTPELLRLCYDAFYVPSNMALVIMGDVDAARAAALAEACIPPAGTMRTVRLRPEEPPRAFRHRTRRTFPVSQPVYAIGFKADPEKNTLRQELTGQLAAELLLGESSALYERLYTRGLIDADFSADFSCAAGAASFQVCGAGRSPEAVLDELLLAQKTGFSPAQFERLKRSVRGRLLRELDGFESTCYRICETIFAGGAPLCDQALLDTVTLADAQTLLCRTITADRAALSVVLPDTASACGS